MIIRQLYTKHSIQKYTEKYDPLRNNIKWSPDFQFIKGLALIDSTIIICRGWMTFKNKYDKPMIDQDSVDISNETLTYYIVNNYCL